MMKIMPFVYCEAVQEQRTEQGTKPVIIGPLPFLSPSYIPSEYSFAISFGIQGVENWSGKNELKIQFKDTEGSIITEMKKELMDVLPPLSEPNIPPDLLALHIAIDFRNVRLATTGEHKTEIYVNDEFIEGFPIHVLKGGRFNDR